MTQQLFLRGPFVGTNGAVLPNKVECDALAMADIEAMAATFARFHHFGEVEGVPRGGIRIADALRPFCTPGGPRLLADDAYTTGGSMRQHAERLGWGTEWIGFVLFAWFSPPANIVACWVAQPWMHSDARR